MATANGGEFVQVYDVNTGIKQHVPAHWIDDPVLGRNIKKTPSQRALDGDLGQAPTADSTVPEIRAFAKDAEIDITGLTTKDDLLGAVRAAVGDQPLPAPGADEGVAVQPTTAGTGDTETPAGEQPTGDTTTEHDPDETPAAGDKES